MRRRGAADAEGSLPVTHHWGEANPLDGGHRDIETGAMIDHTPGGTGNAAAAPSGRTTVRRGAPRARYERTTIIEVLDSAVIAHVGVETADGPLVLPMAYGHDGKTMYLHGALSNSLLGAGDDTEICATVTLLDGLVLARTAFHNSMNYRCVVVRGRGRKVHDSRERERALQLISDHVVATWDNGRTPTDAELRRTLVLALPLTEASAKVRTGDPVDEPEDLDGPHWAGTVAVNTVFGPPVTSADVPDGIAVPEAVRHLCGDATAVD